MGEQDLRSLEQAMAAMPGNPILVMRSTPCPGVAVLTLNRPEKRNALSQAMINSLVRELALASGDPSVKAVVLSGGPAFFCAGADIKEISEMDAESANKHRYLEDLCNAMSTFRKPIFSAVEAMALGGGLEICLMSDLIFASKGCKFGLPEVKIGVIPGAGGTQRLTNAVGKFQAMKMILFGAIIDVDEASSHGLIAGTFPPGAVLDGAVKVAQQVAGMSSTAVRLAKEAICRSDSLGRDDEFEKSLYYFSFGTAHKREGISAFLQKRQPDWEAADRGA